tara:strand:- start:181 stop:1041 length:861 start_codon:yes stop_codon:yes gene_type:complete
MKKITYFLEFIIVYKLFIIFKIIGYRASSNLGYLIGKFFGTFFRSKLLINANLKKAKISNNENTDQITNNILGNYGRIFAEYTHLKNFRNNKLDKFIEIEGMEYLDNIKKRNKKAVFVSGHFNNFELMAMQIEKAGIDLAVIYRPLNNIFLNKVMEKIRKNYICKKQIKKGRAGTREIIKNLNKGSSIALMIDQRVTQGIKINFFGNMASTTTIPAQLIKKYDCELVPIYIERYNNYYFKMYISKPIQIEKKKSIKDITLFLNSILEKMILKNTDQWIWSHDRWRE